MTLDEVFRDQISRGQPPFVALHNAAQAYAAKIKLEYRRPDCSQYADETAAWGEQQDLQVVELLREARRLLEKASDRPVWTAQEIDWVIRVDKFLEGKQ